MNAAAALRIWLDQAQRDWLDVEGRPLGEASSSLYPADTVEVVCPYSGKRNGKMMNDTARLQVLRHRDAGLVTVAGLGPEASAGDLLRVTTAVIVAPLFHARPTPAEISAAYKTNLGFQQVLLSLALDTPDFSGTPIRQLPDAATLLPALDAGSWLVGQRQACAGAPGDIALAWEIMCGRRAPPDARPFLITDGHWALAATALIVALVLATQERLARGDRTGLAGFGTESPQRDAWPLGARLWDRRAAPWLVAATARADRSRHAVRHLFDRGVPSAVEAFLERSDQEHRALEKAFWSAVERLPPISPP